MRLLIFVCLLLSSLIYQGKMLAQSRFPVTIEYRQGDLAFRSSKLATITNQTPFVITVDFWKGGDENQIVRQRLSPGGSSNFQRQDTENDLVHIYLSQEDYEESRQMLFQSWPSLHNNLVSRLNLPYLRITPGDSLELHPCFPCYLRENNDLQDLVDCFQKSRLDGRITSSLSEKSPEWVEASLWIANLKQLEHLREASSGLKENVYSSMVTPMSIEQWKQKAKASFHVQLPNYTLDWAWPFWRGYSYPHLSDQWRGDTMRRSWSISAARAISPEFSLGKGQLFARLYLSMGFQRHRWMLDPAGSYAIGEQLITNRDPGIFDLSDSRYLRLNLNSLSLGLMGRMQIVRSLITDVGLGINYQNLNFNVRANDSELWNDEVPSARRGKYQDVLRLNSPFAPFGMISIQTPLVPNTWMTYYSEPTKLRINFLVKFMATTINIQQGERYQIYERQDSGALQLLANPFVGTSQLITSMRIGLSIDWN